MTIRRRDFLKTVALAGSAMLVYQPVLNAFQKPKPGEDQFQTLGKWIPSTCQGCTTWCAIEINVQNDRVVKVRGNSNSKVNPGYVCPRGHMIPRMHYDPDRIKVPMKRTNPQKGKGIDPQFVPITWTKLSRQLPTK